jgi:metallo-beta-lactamase class B
VEISPYLDGVWLHTTWRTYQGTLIPSHGLIIEEPGKLWLIDSAWGDARTLELLTQIEQKFGRAPDALLITHSHEDRASGLDHIAGRGIPVWASTHTVERLPKETQALITHTIDDPERPQPLADSNLTIYWPGPGHTFDNIVVWEPRQKLIFGGCLIRPGQSTSLGNTADAHIEEWGQSVKHILDTFPDVAHVVPAHGKPGGAEVLTHTVTLTQAHAPHP